MSLGIGTRPCSNGSRRGWMYGGVGEEVEVSIESDSIMIGRMGEYACLFGSMFVWREMRKQLGREIERERER